jgi:hypothetical protein
MPAFNIRTRSTVKWSATVLAFAGWAGSAWFYAGHGFTAGIHPGFITSLSVAIAFTMVAGQWWALPSREAREEQAAIYALGMERGLGCGACPLRPEPGSEADRKRLELVKR